SDEDREDVGVVALVERAELGAEAGLGNRERPLRSPELATGGVARTAGVGESAVDGGEPAAGAVEARVERVELEHRGPLARRRGGAVRTQTTYSIGSTRRRERQEHERAEHEHSTSDCPQGRRKLPQDSGS